MKSFKFLIIKPDFKLTKRFIKTLPKSTTVKIDDSIEIGNFKQYKNHPGKNIYKYIQLPSELEDRINKVLSDINITQLRDEAYSLKKYLQDRRCPVEKNEIHSLKEKIKLENFVNESKSTQEYSEEQENKLEKILKSKLHPWLKIEYNKRLSAFYLVSRFASDYSVLYQIFSEIKKKDEKFSPKHLFDFGSGVGTVMWASKYVWENEALEYLNIDISSYMNSIADLITKNGSLNNQSCFKSAVFKRNFQKSGQEEFDLVTCSFSLLELPNRATRFENLVQLWQKVKKDGYLVLVEIGTKHGFKIINEAREFILRELIKENEFDNKETKSEGHVFLPCPHQHQCPLVAENQTCRFFASYKPLEIYDLGKNIKEKEEFPYSYVVFKKSSKPHKSVNWPRFVFKQPLEINGGVLHSWLCTSEGKVEHLISSKNRCKVTRSLTKYSKMGDNMPVLIDTIKNS